MYYYYYYEFTYGACWSHRDVNCLWIMTTTHQHNWFSDIPLNWGTIFYNILMEYMQHDYILTWTAQAKNPPPKKKKKKKIRAAFYIPLTKSATLNRLLHCSLWQFSGALFCILGAKSPGAPVWFFYPGTAYEPLILCLYCHKWSCGTYQIVEKNEML